MKRLLFLLTLVLSLASCAAGNISDNFSAYHGMSSEQVFNMAELATAKGHFDDATKDYEALDALYPFGAYAEQGLLDSIYAYYKDSQPEMALANAERFIQLYPQNSHVDYAYYMKGIVLFNQDLSWLQHKFSIDPARLNLANNQEAFSAFSALVRFYPHSVYAPDSMARLYYLRDVFARSELYKAQYYFARQAYVAAANRASVVVQHYAGTKTVMPALKLLAQCYQHLGLSTLQHNTEKLIVANHA